MKLHFSHLYIPSIHYGFSPELPPLKKKRILHSPEKTKVEKIAKTAASHSSNTTMKQLVKSKVVNTQPPSKPASISAKTSKLKPLHSKQIKTASGGVHLTFHDSSSSSESSHEIDNSKTSTDTFKPATSPLPSRVVGPIEPFMDPLIHIAKQVATRGKTRGRGKKSRRGKINFVSNLIIGGPDDIHSTLSTLYNKSDTSKQDESVCDSPILKQNSQPLESVCSENTTRPATGWDVGPEGANSTLQSSVETSRSDYSGLPDLSGAPRIGDTLAFKVCAKYLFMTHETWLLIQI